MAFERWTRVRNDELGGNKPCGNEFMQSAARWELRGLRTVVHKAARLTRMCEMAGRTFGA